MTLIFAAIVLIYFAVKILVYHDWYTATTTPAYRKKYGRDTYDHKMYKLALVFYLIGAAMVILAVISI